MHKGRKIVLILVILAALAAGGYFAARHFLGTGTKAGSEDVAYVDSVANLMGMNAGGGMVNRFAGVVESQETWSVNQNQEYTVEEVYVSVGDEVKEGDPLFKYEIEQFESQLTQADIDMERLNNELESMQKTKEQLEKDAKKASSSEKANYTIQIQEQELNLKQKQIDIQSKQLEIDKLKDNIEHATVTSGLTGVVKSVNNGGMQQNYGYGEDSNAFITIMQVGDFRVKGTINEQNMYDINVGEPVIVYSRVDNNQTWRGTIERVDTENAQSNQNMYYGGGDSGNQSSNYPFYVVLDDSTGLMLGQHVYMEIDYGQGEEEKKDYLSLYEFMIDMSDPDHPFVWKEENGKLVKQTVTLGDHDEDLMTYAVLEGLTADDRIAMPEERLKEGMATADMAEMVYEEEGMDGGMMEEGMPMEGDMMEEGMPMEGDMMEEGMPMEGDMMEEGMPTEGDMMEEGMPTEEMPSEEMPAGGE